MMRPGPAWSLATAALLSVWLIAPSGANAELYEYVEADGTVVYTNARLPDRNGRVVFFPGRGARSRPVIRSDRDTSPDRYTRYDAHLYEAARMYRLPIALLRAVIHAESDFDANVVSGDGAMGLMQLMPRTARNMGVSNPFDPRQNILGGARFLRILANQWQGDLVLTVASYNAGPGAVERHNGVPPFPETRNYVTKVIELYNGYRGGA